MWPWNCLRKEVGNLELTSCSNRASSIGSSINKNSKLVSSINEIYFSNMYKLERHHKPIVLVRRPSEMKLLVILLEASFILILCNTGEYPQVQW